MDRAAGTLLGKHQAASWRGLFDALGMVQAQDIRASLWALGMRRRGATEASVRAAIGSGELLRVHALRGTWQWVHRDDARDLLALAREPVVHKNARRYRQLGLDHAQLQAAAQAMAENVTVQERTRAELATILDACGHDVSGQRLPYMLQYAQLDGWLCSGPLRGTEHTYARLDARALEGRAADRAAVAADLAQRFRTSRWRATRQDFAWWTGLPAAEVSAAWVGTENAAITRAVAPQKDGAFLLPAFDEVLVSHQDRGLFLDPAHAHKVNAGGGMIAPTILSGGRIIGTWRCPPSDQTLKVETFEPASAALRSSIEQGAQRYAAFVGRDLTVAWPKRV